MTMQVQGRRARVTRATAPCARGTVTPAVSMPLLRRLCDRVAGLDVQMHVFASGIELRRSRTFAILWDVDSYRAASFPMTLSIVLPYQLCASRVAGSEQLTSRTWLHHIHLLAPEDADVELLDWLDKACIAAG